MYIAFRSPLSSKEIFPRIPMKLVSMAFLNSNWAMSALSYVKSSSRSVPADTERDVSVAQWCKRLRDVIAI